jgi:outer membrane protein
VAGAELNQLLWDGGKVLNALKAANTEHASAVENIRDVEAQVRLAVKQTFYQVLYTEKVIEVLKIQLSQLRDHLRTIQTRFKKGLESDYTLMRQQVEVSNIEPQLIQAERNRELLVNALKILMAVDPQEPMDPVGVFSYSPHSIVDVAALIEKARSTRPDLNSQRLREKSLIAGVSVEKAGYWPQFTFNTTYQWQGQTDNWGLSSNEIADSLSSIVQMSWPIFDGLKTKSRIEQAKAKLMQQQFSNSQLEDSVVREVEDARTTLDKAQAAYRSQLGSFNLAKKATAIASTRFEAGLMSQLELNDTITSQAQAEQLYLQAVYECLSAEAVLEKAIGGAM